jgi:cyclopropane fatty-acyl-phospholipid synthase-like methyltransferase
MLLDSVRNLLGLHAAASVRPHPALPPERSPTLGAALEEDDDPVWPSARIAVAEALWGEGFLLPGGGEEVVRLAKPLGLSAASSLLLIGAGTGGPPRHIAAELGVWVSGYEANPRLAALANERNQRAGLGRRAEVQSWDRRKPKFPPRYFHGGIGLEPLRGEPPEALLAAVAKALKPGGQFVLEEVVADQPLDPAEPSVETWTRLDHRAETLPGELAITRSLAHLGFDVRIVEDVSRRQMQQALQGWSAAVQAMRDTHPALRQVSLVVREAELWLARFRLMRASRLRLVRWHAIAAG